MKRKISFLIAAAVLFSFNCTGDKWEGEISTQGDVKIIENRGAGLWEGKKGKDISFEESLTLGQEQGEDHLMFYKLRDLTVDSDLNLYVLDAGNHRMLNFIDSRENFYFIQTDPFPKIIRASLEVK